ncbi:MAG: DUF2200 domain-containing protein [Actinomycetota bacterium]
MTEQHRIFGTSVASVYPHYVAKAERKGRTKAEVDEIICWLTGYDSRGLEAQLAGGTEFRRFFADAPAMNPARLVITGSVCGVKVQELEPGLMQEIRFLDKLVDELAKGRPMAKILRSMPVGN